MRSHSRYLPGFNFRKCLTFKYFNSNCSQFSVSILCQDPRQTRPYSLQTKRESTVHKCDPKDKKVKAFQRAPNP